MAIAGKKNLNLQYSARTLRRRFALREPLFGIWEEVMEWFSQKTSIAGVQVSNWMVVLGAIIVILIIYTSIH